MLPAPDLDAVSRILADAAGSGNFSGVIHLSRDGEVLLSESYGLASRRWQAVPRQERSASLRDAAAPHP